MVSLREIEPLDREYLEELGFIWHTDSDGTPYLSDRIVEITEAEAEAYYRAGNELYDMFVEAGEYVIENDLLHDIGIPFNLTELVKQSWEEDVHWHLYGRFDLAGGIDGRGIKLLEFNADTPTSLFESAIVQWAALRKNGLDEASQFNMIFEKLLENFRRITTLDESINNFDEIYDGWKFLFSSVRGSIEEENTVKFLEYIASEAGYESAFAYADEVEFDPEAGISCNGTNYELWFKLIPWESIAVDEPDLAMLLTQIVKNKKAIIFNPAYTLMFQSKAMLKILWDLYPNHPLLLESSFEPLSEKHLSKPFFGREGGNITIYDGNGNILESCDGDYGNEKTLYQSYYELPCDSEGYRYQAGLFFAYESCGLGFRRGGEIINDMSKFCGHIVV